MTNIKFGILGQAFHCPKKGEYEYLEKALITISDTGKIIQVLQSTDPRFEMLTRDLTTRKVLIELNEEQYLLPGMVDLHIHAPQWPQSGKGLDLPLYDWLQNYTFPLESKFSEQAFANEVYPDVVNTLLANGTTSAVYFATIDTDTSLELAKTCIKQGQRAFVGKVCMDNAEQCPSFYIESTAQAIDNTEAFINDIFELKDNKNKLVSPVITPRFVPSCTEQLLKKLGSFAQNYHCHVQTHCAESDWARDYSLANYGKSDVKIYEDFGLMTDKTILAHSIFLDNDDHEIIKQRQASIAHCPLSNMFFANAAMQAREILDNNIICGLGSDLAGAPKPSIFHTCLDAVTHSRIREDGTSIYLTTGQRGESGKRISFLDAYWMATVGGGLSINQQVGLFKTGYEFDALVMDSSVSDTDLNLSKMRDSHRDILEKIICLSARQNITRVWVQGREVINKQG